jgi:hypothetical protein
MNGDDENAAKVVEKVYGKRLATKVKSRRQNDPSICTEGSWA